MASYTSFISQVAPLAKSDWQANGVLASVTIAQAILESAGGTSELYTAAFNTFGMKTELSGNTWANSTWDGVSKYTKQTQEQDAEGNISVITADFRKYPSLADSVGDHSAYLLGAKNGSSLRYAGLKGETDPQTAITIIKNGGYATDVSYVTKVMNIINTYNLTQYDALDTTEVSNTSLNIIQKNGTANTTAAANRKIEYIVVHYSTSVKSTAGKAADTAEWFANASAGASADFIVDDGTIVQYNSPANIKNRYTWAVGGSKQNSKGGSLYGTVTNKNSISVEICSTNSTGTVKDANDSSWSFTDAALNNAEALIKYLLEEYSLTADKIVRHYDVNGKLCPGICGYNLDSGDESKWQAFKARFGSTSSTTTTTTTTTTTDTTESYSDNYYRVRKSWEDSSSQIGAYSSLDNAKKAVDSNTGYKAYDPNGFIAYPYETFKVKTTESKVRIRKGPGSSYDCVGYAGKGVYNITRTEFRSGSSNSWGLLKSYTKTVDGEPTGEGWVNLHYFTKVS